MALKRSSKQLVDEASARITTLTIDEAKANLGNPGVLFVDIRDVRELDREGMIPGAFHAPRGMLEFWVDPESPYYKDIFRLRKALHPLLPLGLALGPCDGRAAGHGPRRGMPHRRRVRRLETERRPHRRTRVQPPAEGLSPVQQLGLDAVTLVDRKGAPITGEEVSAACGGGCGHERVVGGAAGNPMLG